MKFVGERVDYGNVGVGGHFFKNALVIDAGDDALHPAIEIASDIGDGFACAERGGGLGVIEENDRAAHALDADVESDASAERRLFENEGDEFSLQRGSVADGTRFYVGGEVEEFAGVRGTPLGSGEEIVGQRNGRYESGCGHLFTSLRIARSAARWQRIAREQPKWIWEFLRERTRRDAGIREPARW